MSFLTIVFILILVYFLSKPLRNIMNAVFGDKEQHYDSQSQQSTGSQKTSNKTSMNTESKNRIIKDDEGEYVDYEEIKDNK